MTEQNELLLFREMAEQFQVDSNTVLPELGNDHLSIKATILRFLFIINDL